MKLKSNLKMLTLNYQLLKFMDIQTEKLLLIEQLLRIRDGRVIAQVRELLKKENSPVVGYEADGRAITQQDFIKKIEQAEREHAQGNFQTIQDVEQESQGW
jgi:hypothetical protein